MLPSKYAEPERYKGRPLLVILENYVLDTIGVLPPERQEGMQRLVEKVWPGPDWRKTVRETLHLPAHLDGAIRELWQKNQGAAHKAAEELTPVQFAKMFVDENFTHLIPPIQRN